MNFPSRIVIIVSILLLSACNGLYGNGSKPSPSPSPTLAPRIIDTTCADLVAKTFTSYSPVPGGFECLSAGMQNLMVNAFGVYDDQSFANWIATYPSLTETNCNDAAAYDQTHNFQDYYQVNSDGSHIQVRYYFRESDGRVDELQVAGINPASSVTVTTDPVCGTKIKWPKPVYDE